MVSTILFLWFKTLIKYKISFKFGFSIKFYPNLIPNMTYLLSTHFFKSLLLLLLLLPERYFFKTFIKYKNSFKFSFSIKFYPNLIPNMSYLQVLFFLMHLMRVTPQALIIIFKTIHRIQKFLSHLVSA
jgi:hypothetical protein